MLSVNWVAFEVPAWLQTNFRTILLSSLNFGRDVVVSICTVSNEISPRKYLIAWIRNSHLLALSFLRYVIWFITWIANKFPSINFKLSFKLVLNILLDWIFKIVSCVGGKILKLTLGQYLIVRFVYYFIANSYSLIIKIWSIVRICIELTSHLELLWMLYLLGRSWLFIE